MDVLGQLYVVEETYSCISERKSRGFRTTSGNVSGSDEVFDCRWPLTVGNLEMSVGKVRPVGHQAAVIGPDQRNRRIANRQAGIFLR